MKTLPIIGTPLAVTTYELLQSELFKSALEGRKQIVDFTNTQIVTMRRHDPEFRAVTADVDWFIPDGMPLIWILNSRGAGLTDRVYGPTCMRRVLENSCSEIRHFFLGGSAECLRLLVEKARAANPNLTVVGERNGYFAPDEEPRIVDLIKAANPHFIWIGLGTPKQQQWIDRNHRKFTSGTFLNVGFAFDVNAGTKPDAPAWMQRFGLTWIFRLLSEPKRLGPRYLKYNTLFCWYVLRNFLSPNAGTSSGTSVRSSD